MCRNIELPDYACRQSVPDEYLVKLWNPQEKGNINVKADHHNPDM